jgi:hypothetical protein
MILLNLTTNSEAQFWPLDVHFCLFLAKAYGWRPAGADAHPVVATMLHHDNRNYYQVGRTWTEPDCRQLHARLCEAWPGALTWSHGIRDRDRARTVVDPSGTMLHWDGPGEFDRMPFIAESPFRKVDTMAALVRLVALLAPGGAIRVAGQPPLVNPAIVNLSVRGTPLLLRVKMLRGRQSGLESPEVWWTGETYTIEASQASLFVASGEAHWLDAPMPRAAPTTTART